jgi:hypothetical protein
MVRAPGCTANPPRYPPLRDHRPSTPTVAAPCVFPRRVTRVACWRGGLAQKWRVSGGLRGGSNIGPFRTGIEGFRGNVEGVEGYAKTYANARGREAERNHVFTQSFYKPSTPLTTLHRRAEVTGEDA